MLLFNGIVGVVKETALKNFAKFTEKHLRWKLFLVMLRPCLKVPRKCIPINISEFSEFILRNSGKRLLLCKCFKFV